MGMYKKTIGGIGLAAAMGAWLSTATLAAENGVLNYPAGAPAIFIGAFPPIPGLFMASQMSFSYADALYDSHGKKLSVPFHMDAQAETLRFLASYSADLFGAHLLSQLVVPMVHLDLKVPNFGPGPSSFSDSGSGFGNVTVTPLIMDWTLSRTQHIALGLDIATEAATYSSTKIASVGNGYMSFMPTVAYRYNDPTGFDVGIAPRLSFNTLNTTTNYQSGTALIVDLEAGYNIGKWKFGVAGGYTQQLEDDTHNGVAVANSRLTQFTLGPSVTYTTMPYIFNFNWQPGLYAENGAKVSSIWATVALPLSVGRGPLEGGKPLK